MGEFRSFWFDCDSTLSAIEGVDELTLALPKALQREIKALTEAAMNGTVPLAEVYERRLATIAPSRDQLEAVGKLYVEKLVPGDARGSRGRPRCAACCRTGARCPGSR